MKEEEDLYAILLCGGIILIVVIVGCFCSSYAYKNDQLACSKLCYPNNYQIDHNHHASDKCYCEVNGELKLKRIL